MSDFSDNNVLDSELESLLAPIGSTDDKPDFDDLFSDNKLSSPKAEEVSMLEDITSEEFHAVIDFECEPKPYFNNPNYYKFLLTGMGDISDKLHKTLQSYLRATDPKDKTVYRQRMIPLYWELIRKQVEVLSEDSEMPRRLLIRYGALLPNVISAEQRKMLSSIIFENRLDEPVHYVDEWFLFVGRGDVAPLATDEEFTYRKKSKDVSAIKQQLTKARGEKDSYIAAIRNLEIRQKSVEKSLMMKAQVVSRHERSRVYTGVRDPYNQSQRASLGEILSHVKELQNIDREIKERFDSLRRNGEKLKNLEQQAHSAGVGTSVDPRLASKEVDSIRQMAKMSVGRQGNHMPMLMKQFFFSNIKAIATRENIIDLLRQFENIDPGVFRRTFRQKTTRIVPHVIILPCFGDRGLCWEPFEKTNKSTSRGRIGIPMFPKDLKVAVLTALGDLRWQVAKEKAQHYWMQEGLTGHYYEWFDSKKLRGDVRLKFIQDYILWMTKESEGVQKLDKDVRGIFWRDMPFPLQLRESLRKRGFVYNELFKKDKNREMSDGY
ncbi:hypothetical protein [Spirochaeta isovalerica]|uniref:Uncharacterized protein n=1 Tax=Spirochaeta isovalerica TaxID=150 RepID=A0A841RJW7_9SPIO|nr:hypothetical protein [Spirochaeta isovalerica]MBB6482582.1 hypothetical protein [Spirochaeta isovalerica]